MARDVLSLETDKREGEALLEPVMQSGRRLGPSPALPEIRALAASNLGRLPEALRSLDPGAVYPVIIAAPLHELAAETDRRLSEQAAT